MLSNSYSSYSMLVNAKINRVKSLLKSNEFAGRIPNNPNICYKLYKNIYVFSFFFIQFFFIQFFFHPTFCTMDSYYILWVTVNKLTASTPHDVMKEAWVNIEIWMLRNKYLDHNIELFLEFLNGCLQAHSVSLRQNDVIVSFRWIVFAFSRFLWKNWLFRFFSLNLVSQMSEKFTFLFIHTKIRHHWLISTHFKLLLLTLLALVHLKQIFESETDTP